MRVKRWAAMLAVLMAVSACSSEVVTGAQATDAPAPDFSIHESGVDSPLGFGFTVPPGATQIGPLARFRSAALIQAYQPELTLALQNQAAEAAERALARSKNGTNDSDDLEDRQPYVPPLADTFSLIDQPPRPDVTYAHMRIDGDETDVFQAMLGQIRAILPDSDVHPNSWPEYCTIRDDRIERCIASARGIATNGHEISVTVRVDVGDLDTRIASAGSELKAVMTLGVSFISDPKVSQIDKGSFERAEIPQSPEPTPPLPTWPAMDTEADTTTPLLDGEFIADESVTVLLSGSFPRFAVLLGQNAEDLSNIGLSWVQGYSDAGDVKRDVVEDLNEFSTTFTAHSSKKGLVARATLVQSGRGNYLLMWFSPEQ